MVEQQEPFDLGLVILGAVTIAVVLYVGAYVMHYVEKFWIRYKSG